MEITRSNFEQSLPLIKLAIESADFISIDGEFTGISSNKNTTFFDTPEERYIKIRESSQDYLVIQFGICTFKYDEASNKYDYKPFNFYIFPRTLNRTHQDTVFLSQSSSLEFLLDQGFDFNKLIKDGIPFLTNDIHNRLLEKLEEKHKEQLKNVCVPYKKSNGELWTPVPEEHREFIKKFKTQLEELLSSDEQTSLKLEPCNSFLRKLIYECVEQKNLASLHVSTQSNDQKERFLVIKKSSPQDIVDELKKKQQEEVTQLDEVKGFCKVIQIISNADKLIVGHNMMLDVMNVLRQFVCPLPEAFNDFRDLVKCVFNNLVDTKLLASSEKLRDHFQVTSLSEVLKRLQSPPFVMPRLVTSDGHPAYTLTEAKLHEAGFDAFITGISFIGLSHYLSKKHFKTLNSEAPVLSQFINKIYMMQSSDIQFLNIGNDDMVPQRNHVFRVTFPKEWRTSELVELFSSYGAVFISWIGDTSAFVSLKNPDLAPNVYSDLVSKARDNYNVISYQDFKSRDAATASSSFLGASSSRKTSLQNAALPPSRRQKSQPTAGVKRFLTDISPRMGHAASMGKFQEKQQNDKKKSKKRPQNPQKKTSSQKQKGHGMSPLFQPSDDWS